MATTEVRAKAGAAPVKVSGVLVAIPCFNEELAIGSVILRSRRHCDQVLVVDDGSSDRTSDVAREAGAAVIRHERNAGKGQAVRAAFQYARDQGYQAMVLIDGDGQHDPGEIPALLAPIIGESPHADIALGFRFGAATQMPAWRRVGKRVLDYATAAGGAGVVTDSQCGYRAFNRRAIEAMADTLQGDGFGIESEQLVRAREAKLRLQNVPITCAYDEIDGSTKGPVAHAVDVLSNIVSLVTARRPLLTIGLPSLALLLLSAVLAVRTLQFYNQTHVLSIPGALAAATLALLGTFGALSALILNLVVRLEKALERRR